jgi:hypothetical protein
MGLVIYDYGRLRIFNRMALGQMGCECYDAVRGEFDGLYETYPMKDHNSGYRSLRIRHVRC